MEQESRAGCILHGCGVLAALAGLCAASGAACVFALTPGWRVWALPVFFLLALAGAACGLLLYAAGSALQILCDIRRARPVKKRRPYAFSGLLQSRTGFLPWHRYLQTKKRPALAGGAVQSALFLFHRKSRHAHRGV